MTRRARKDQSPDALTQLDEAVSEAYRPLISSVCRRYLRRPEDVEDAVQETLVKLAHHAREIRGSVVAWLTSTASACSVDLIRRQVRERRRREALASGNPGLADNTLIGETVRRNLRQAILLLGDADRRLILDRFFRRLPLRVIAERERTAVATVARRAARAIEALSAIFRDLGFESIDDLALAEHLGATTDVTEAVDAAGAGLRFAPDWRSAGWSVDPLNKLIASGFLPGWNRPIRVGAFVSLRSLAVVDKRGLFLMSEHQVMTTRLLLHPGIQLVGLVEPQSTEHGVIERTLRDYELTAGLIDATDVKSLRTLDVILLGINYLLTPGVAAALSAAVREGVGLLNEWWVDVHRVENANTMDLVLADSPIYPYHMPRSCSGSLPATVHEEHPLLPGVRQGSPLAIAGCGPLYRVKKSARVLITKDVVVPPEQHQIPGLGPARMPVYIVGTVGAGRVVVANLFDHGRFASDLRLPSDYLVRLLGWLAEPRRERAEIMGPEEEEIIL